MRCEAWGCTWSRRWPCSARRSPTPAPAPGHRRGGNRRGAAQPLRGPSPPGGGPRKTWSLASITLEFGDDLVYLLAVLNVEGEGVGNVLGSEVRVAFQDAVKTVTTLGGQDDRRDRDPRAADLRLTAHDPRVAHHPLDPDPGGIRRSHVSLRRAGATSARH